MAKLIGVKAITTKAGKKILNITLWMLFPITTKPMQSASEIRCFQSIHHRRLRSMLAMK